MKTYLNYLKWFFITILDLNIKPDKGIKVVKNYSGYLTQKGIPVSLLKLGTLVFITSEGIFNNKTGTFISYSHSIFGKSYIEYDINGKRYWRYSYCKYNKSLKCFIQIHLGYDDNESIFRFKMTKKKLIN